MSTLTIDTEEFAARLTRAKVSKEQAAAITKGLEKDVRLDTTELATKKDLEVLSDRLTIKFLLMLIGLFIANIGADKFL